MNVMLKPELEKFVAEKLRMGQFSDVSDMINEALKALQEQEEFTSDEENYFRGEIAPAIEELDRGEHSEFTAETIIAEERRRMAGQRGNGNRCPAVKIPIL